MMSNISIQPMVMVSLDRLARQAAVARLTARRRLQAANVRPDALLVTGGRKHAASLFLSERTPSLVQLIGNGPEIIA
jgi:hypothetical protein